VSATWAATLPIHLAFWQRTLIGLVVVLVVAPALALGLQVATATLRIRARRGSGSTAGPGGVLQPLADLGRAVQSEDVLPSGASAVLAETALALAIAAPFAALAVIPAGPDQVMAPAGAGVPLGVAALVVCGLASWWADGRGVASRAEGAVTFSHAAIAAALLCFAAAAAAVSAGAASLAGVVSGQIHHAVFGWDTLGVPGLILHPFAFFVWLAALAALFRVGPFRMAGAGVPYAIGGLRAWAWSLARWLGVLAGCALGATLFLGGWAVPGHPTLTTASVLGPLVLACKTLLLAGVLVTVDVGWPSLGLAARWGLLVGWLLPLALIDLGATVFAKLVW
jgi:NADH-quinone oxidoreductase subunit H